MAARAQAHRNPTVCHELQLPVFGMVITPVMSTPSDDTRTWRPLLGVATRKSRRYSHCQPPRCTPASPPWRRADVVPLRGALEYQISTSSVRYDRRCCRTSHRERLPRHPCRNPLLLRPGTDQAVPPNGCWPLPLAVTVKSAMATALSL